MENSTGNTDKNLREQAKNIKQRKDTGICRDKKEKATQKITIQLEEISHKLQAKEGRLKRYGQRVKQYRQNRIRQNNERKFSQQLVGDDTKTYQKLYARENEEFSTKIWQPKSITKMSTG